MKFRIKDEDGKDYEVEEILEKKSEEDAEPVAETVEETKIELSQDEIKSLKELAAKAPQLLELLQVEEKEHEDNPELVDADEDMNEEEDFDEDKEMNDDEEVIETCEEKSTHDSKSSFGALESKNTSCNDAIEEDEVSLAWAKRYGGIK